MTNDTRDPDATRDHHRSAGDAPSPLPAEEPSAAAAPAAGDEGDDGDDEPAEPGETGARYEEPELPDGGTLEGAVEALLLVANGPLELSDFTELLDDCSWVLVRRALRAIQKRLAKSNSGFELIEVAKGWRLLTRPLYADVVERLSVIEREQRLTRAQLEVLSIVAYRQPVKRSDVDSVRGADSSGSLRAVIDKGLIRVTGRADQLGRPLLYGTTRHFLERFGLKDITKLPKPKDL